MTRVTTPFCVCVKLLFQLHLHCTYIIIPLLSLLSLPLPPLLFPVQRAEACAGVPEEGRPHRSAVHGHLSAGTAADRDPQHLYSLLREGK